MKAAALAFFGAALSVTLPAASPAQNSDQNQAGAPSASQAGDRERYCQGLTQRAQELRNDAARARDHGDFAHARDQLDDITNRLAHDCNH